MHWQIKHGFYHGGHVGYPLDISTINGACFLTCLLPIIQEYWLDYLNLANPVPVFFCLLYSYSHVHSRRRHESETEDDHHHSSSKSSSSRHKHSKRSRRDHEDSEGGGHRDHREGSSSREEAGAGSSKDDSHAGLVPDYKSEWWWWICLYQSSLIEESLSQDYKRRGILERRLPIAYAGYKWEWWIYQSGLIDFFKGSSWHEKVGSSSKDILLSLVSDYKSQWWWT